MKFRFIFRGEPVGSVEYREGEYLYDFREDFFWLENYIADLLSAPIYEGERKLFPPAEEHMRATMKFFSILKTTDMDWKRFVDAVGGDIREVDIREVTDEG